MKPHTVWNALSRLAASKHVFRARACGARALALPILCVCFPVWAELGRDWVQTAPGPGWAPRSNHASAVFDGKIWVLGGRADSGLKNDVWFPSDGVSWTQAT